MDQQPEQLTVPEQSTIMDQQQPGQPKITLDLTPVAIDRMAEREFNIITGTLELVRGWARKSSLFMLVFGTA